MGRKLLFVFFCVGLASVGCANEPPSASGETDHGKMLALVAVDRTDPAAADGQANASAIARFVSVPAFSDPSRALSAAGATLDLPPIDTCQSSDQDDIEPPLPSQGALEFREAGDVAITASGSPTPTPLVPHAFPTVGGFASGVLYTTRDRASAALPPAVPYVFTTTGSSSIPGLHATADAPRSLANIQFAGTPIADLTEIHTGTPAEITWGAGDGADLVYVEFLAYDGSPSVTCTFRDSGSGTVPADAFSGTGTGRMALHRVRSRHFDGGPTSGEMRFDFQTGASVDFTK